MKKVVTVCPYCASGCKINLVVDNGKIVRAEAAQGKTNPEIAVILSIRPYTVRTHLERVFAKLGVETRHAAGLRAIEVLGLPER